MANNSIIYYDESEHSRKINIISTGFIEIHCLNLEHY